MGLFFLCWTAFLPLPHTDNRPSAQVILSERNQVTLQRPLRNLHGLRLLVCWGSSLQYASRQLRLDSKFFFFFCTCTSLFGFECGASIPSSSSLLSSPSSHAPHLSLPRRTPCHLIWGYFHGKRACATVIPTKIVEEKLWLWPDSSPEGVKVREAARERRGGRSISLTPGWRYT